MLPGAQTGNNTVSVNQRGRATGRTAHRSPLNPQRDRSADPNSSVGKKPTPGTRTTDRVTPPYEIHARDKTPESEGRAGEPKAAPGDECGDSRATAGASQSH